MDSNTQEKLKIANYQIRLQPFVPQEDITTIPDLNIVEVDGLPSCVKYVEIFGPWIFRLFIDFGPHADDNTDLAQCINENCSSSLKEITIRRLSHFQLSQNQLPFRNIERVRIENSNGSIGLKYFANIFRNVIRLEIMEVNFVVEKRLRLTTLKSQQLHFQNFRSTRKRFQKYQRHISSMEYK